MVELNLAYLGMVFSIWIILITGLTFYLAKRKTENPRIASILGFLTSLLPPLALIYIIVLVQKSDIVTKE